SAARLKSSTATVPPAKRFWIPRSSRNVIGGGTPARWRWSPDRDLDPGPGPAADQRDENHRDPGQPEGEEGEGGLLVRLRVADDGQVGRKCPSRQERRDRELADDDRQRQERAAEDRGPKVGQDHLDEDPQPPGTEALRRLGQGVDVDRPEAGV